jgi:hypothetical protein
MFGRTKKQFMGSLWSDVKEQVAVAATSDFPQPA